MQENQTLRSLLRGLGSFIGDGVGGILPKLGWDVTDFNDFVNRSETDTAWESYQRRKKAQSGPPNIGSVSQNIRGQKRSAEEDTIASRPKKSRGPGDLDHDERGQDDYSLLVPMNSGITPIPPKPNMYTPRSNEGAFADLMRGSVEPMFVPTPSSATPSSQYRPPSPHSTYRNSYLPPISMNVEGQLSSLPFSSSNTQQRKPNNGLPSDQAAAEEEAKTDEALKLILYDCCLSNHPFDIEVPII
jgi:hypothetical protein